MHSFLVELSRSSVTWLSFAHDAERKATTLQIHRGPIEAPSRPIEAHRGPSTSLDVDRRADALLPRVAQSRYIRAMVKASALLALPVVFALSILTGGCRSAESCKISPGCQVMGLCSSVGGNCVAATAQDCQQSSGCKDFGFCGLSGNACVVASDADCKASTACKKENKCKANAAAKRCE